MVQTFPLHRPAMATDATIRAFSSLTRRDADAVRATARNAATDYAVHEHDDYDGYLSLLVTPADETRLSYMVAGRTGAVDLVELRDDDMAPIGTYPSIGAAMLVLRPALERRTRISPVPSATHLIERHGPDATLQAALHADAQPAQAGWASILRALDDLGPVP